MSSEETSKVSTLVEWAEGKETDFEDLHKAIRERKAQQFSASGDHNDNSSDEEDDDENIQEPEESGPKLLWAAQRNRQDLIEELLNSDKNLIKFQDSDGYTALHRAAYSGSHESLVSLLKYGADISALTSDGWTALHSACRWNRTRCVETLLAWGADVNKSTIGGQTPLHLAAVTPDSRPTLETLLFHPKLEPMSTNCQDDTALDIAMRNSNPTELFLLALPCFSSTSSSTNQEMALRKVTEEDPLSLAEENLLADSEDCAEMSGSVKDNTNCFMRDTITALHRGTMCDDENMRQASVNSLVEVVKQDINDSGSSGNLTLIVLQTWLEQFTRTNGGGSTSEYCAHDRVRLLQSMMTITDNMFKIQDSNAFRAAVSRAVTLATEEMTRQNDIIDQVQLPCCKILVRFGSRHNCIGRVMDSLMIKFQGSCQHHYYIVTTLSELATCNPTHVVPYLKDIISTMLSNMKSIRKDTMRYAYSNALSRFSEAIMDFLSNTNQDPGTTTKEQFVTEMDAVHEILFNSWLHCKSMILTPNYEVSKVKNAVIEALGAMGPCLSDERLYKNVASPVCSALLGLYKKIGEPYYVTQCVCNLLKAMIERDLQIIDGIIEPLFTALFVQVCQFAAVSVSDNVDNFKRKNHYEVLRCYDLLVRSHPEKLVSGLLLRLNSVDENIRVSSLIVFRHLINSSLEVLQPRMSDIFNAFHSKLTESSNRVRKMLAQLTALLGSLGYLEGQEGQDFLEFIVKLCALPTHDQQKSVTSADLLQYLTTDNSYSGIVTNASLREMCDSILQLLTKEAMEAVLWPFLIDFLLAPEYTNAIPAVIKSLSQLALKLRQDSKLGSIEYGKFKYVHGPYVLLARLLVLAAATPAATGDNASFEEAINVLAFMQNFAPNINKHLSCLWDQRIPLLQHYLERTKVSVDQDQWEEWLMALMDDTLAEIDLDEWNNAFVGSMTQQLNTLYHPGLEAREKAFLMKATGRALTSVKNPTLVTNTLDLLFTNIKHSDHAQQTACSLAFGFASKKHLVLTIEKLEALLKAEFSKKRGLGASSFFGFMRDHKLEDEQLATRCTILRCLGQCAIKSGPPDLPNKADEMCHKFIMPAMQSALPVLKLAALRATSDLAKSLQKTKDFSLTHHQDLIHEAIECMKAKSWTLAEKHIALVTTLELVKLPPFVSQLTRCSILKACFTSVFPSLIRLQQQQSGLQVNVKPSLLAPLDDNNSPISSGQSTPIRKSSDSTTFSLTDSQLKGNILDKLLSLVQALLLQELRQSTLDEIFTLLEPYLKLVETTSSREMAITLLHATLKTYYEKENFCCQEDDEQQAVEQNNFSPGPYIIGSLVPRCFDTSRHIQSTALACLQILVQISKEYRHRFSANKGAASGCEESEEALMALERISASCSPLTTSCFGDLMEPAGVSPALISKTVTNILRLEMSADEMLPLLHSLIDGLSDDVSNAGNGASLILCSLLEHRGREEDIVSQSTLLLGKIHGKLLILDCREETRERALKAVRILASHNALAVIDSLLGEEHSLPFDDAMTSIWHSLTQEKVLAEFLLKHLLGKIHPSSLLAEKLDKFTSKKETIVNHRPLAAILALSICFESKEMEAIVESEFADVFVPLLQAMAVYSMSLPLDQVSKATVKPVQTTMHCLQAFLTCKGCSSMAMSVSSKSNQASSNMMMAEDFGDFVSELSESLCVDFPLYLPRVAFAFTQAKDDESSENDDSSGEKPATCCASVAASFYAQLLLTQVQLDPGLLNLAIEQLLLILSSEKTPLPLLRIVCIRGLGGFKLDTPGKVTSLAKHCQDILDTVMNAVGDDFESDQVNYASLMALVSLIPVMPGTLLSQKLTHLVTKVAPFFDTNKHKKDCSAAFKAFTQLAIFAGSSSAGGNDTLETFKDLVHGVLVSLILHLNDGDEETRQTSNETLKAVFGLYEKTGFKTLEVRRKFNYAEFLKEFAVCPDSCLTDMFPVYIEKAINYYACCTDAKLRANAVMFVTYLLTEASNHLWNQVNAEHICNSMAKLLKDSNAEVRLVTASHLGKVCLALSIPPRPRLSLN